MKTYKTIALGCLVGVMLLTTAFFIQSFNFNTNQFTVNSPYLSIANGVPVTNPVVWTSLTVNSTNPGSFFGGAVVATNGYELPFSLNNIPALVCSAGLVYHTNMTGNLTLASFAGVPASYVWSIYLIATNASGGNLTLTFPNGCRGQGGASLPPVFTVTNQTEAEFQVNGIGQIITNVNWSPH